ncbi:hypothetical protein COP2_003314 [Malus domestica]
MYFSRFLKDNDDVGDPFRILQLLNEACFDQLVSLGLNIWDELGSISSLSLIYRSHFRLDYKAMHGNGKVKAGHFFVSPRKDAFELQKQLVVLFELVRA